VPSQIEVDRLVERVKKLVEKHGTNNPVLTEVRKWYKILSRRVDPLAFVVLEKEVENVENAYFCKTDG
jgi:hypothetical protein